MDNKLLSEFLTFQNKSYTISSLEFEILNLKLLLSQKLNNSQLELFNQYENAVHKLIRQKEMLIINFIDESLKKIDEK